jgi:GTP-binding protein HflX
VDRLVEGEALMKEELIRDLAPNPVMVSAFSGSGLVELKECIYQRLQPLQEYQIRLPNTSEGLSQLSRLYETAELLSVSYGEELVVKLRGKGEAIARLKIESPDSQSKD